MPLKYYAKVSWFGSKFTEVETTPDFDTWEELMAYIKLGRSYGFTTYTRTIPDDETTEEPSLPLPAKGPKSK